MHTMLRVAGVVWACAAGFACAAKPVTTPPPRESSQSQRIEQTFAGKNTCNPDNHERPFVIEWDATDSSSFEQLAAGQVVIVRHEGCTLRILDGCTDDAWRSQQTAYAPVTWTSRALEKVLIASGGELYAKLPLAQATLGARVARDEQFRMEYFVAGTLPATEPSIYVESLKQDNGDWAWGCDGATHFVYAYNLGAFALGSVSGETLSGGGSVYV